MCVLLLGVRDLGCQLRYLFTISFDVFHSVAPILLNDWPWRERFVYVGWSGLLLSDQQFLLYIDGGS